VRELEEREMGRGAVKERRKMDEEGEVGGEEEDEYWKDVGKRGKSRVNREKWGRAGEG